MLREYVIPGSHNDTFTPAGAEVNIAALEQATSATAACLDKIKASCAKRMICGAFQYDGDFDRENLDNKSGQMHISDVRCQVFNCPSVIENILEPRRQIEL